MHIYMCVCVCVWCVCLHVYVCLCVYYSYIINRLHGLFQDVGIIITEWIQISSEDPDYMKEAYLDRARERARGNNSFVYFLLKRLFSRLPAWQPQALQCGCIHQIFERLPALVLDFLCTLAICAKICVCVLSHNLGNYAQFTHL